MVNSEKREKNSPFTIYYLPLTSSEGIRRDPERISPETLQRGREP
jgi:hypothetical protein